MSSRQGLPKIDVGSDSIRTLTRRDLPRVTEHFLRLEPTARCERFGRGVSDADIAAYAQRLPIDRGVLAGSFPDGELRGLIEARSVAGKSCHWECVLSVEQDWRRQGLASKLAARAFMDARQAGASRVYMRCSITNTAAQYFLACFTHMLREEDGDAVATVDLSDTALAAAVIAGQRRNMHHV